MLWVGKLWKGVGGADVARAPSTTIALPSTAKGAREAGSICDCVSAAVLPARWRASRPEHLDAPLSIGVQSCRARQPVSVRIVLLG